MMQGHHLAAREVLELALPALEQATATTEHNFIGFIADPQATVLALLRVSPRPAGAVPSGARTPPAGLCPLPPPCPADGADVYPLVRCALCHPAWRRGASRGAGRRDGDPSSTASPPRVRRPAAGSRGGQRAIAAAPGRRPPDLPGFYEENRALGMLSGAAKPWAMPPRPWSSSRSGKEPRRRWRRRWRSCTATGKAHRPAAIIASFARPQSRPGAT